MTKTLNMNNTKKELLEAYEGVLSQLQKLQSEKLDPQREVSIKKQQETLSEAEDIASKSIEDQIASLQKNISGVFNNLSSSFTKEIDSYNNIKKAIQLKEAELKELFDIEKQAFTLAALINTHKELTEKFNSETAQRKEQAISELNDINNQIKEARIQFEEEIKKEKEALRVEREREKEQHEYEFARYKQKQKDTLADELAQERREFEVEVNNRQSELNEYEANLDKRDEDITARENKVEELEATVAAFPEQLATAKAEAHDAGKKEAERVAAIKENYIKKEADSQKQILENKIDLLTESLQSEKQKSDELARKLDEAYNKIQNMALASVDGSKAQAATENLIKSLNQNK